MRDKPTLDTNILIYAFGKPEDYRKDIAIDIIAKCSIISVQAVNETVQVLLRKFNFPHHELEKVLGFMKRNFIISDLNIVTVEQSLKIMAQYCFSYWDSMMVAAAINNHCSILYSEDLHHEQIIEGRLQIINPFIKPR